MKRDAAGVNRYCAWNARYTDGSYYGETQASPTWSGYVKIDITRNSDPDSQRSVITYHFNPGSGYYSYIDIDGSNLWGAWPNNPRSPQIADYIWPTICVANNNNIILATGDMGANAHHLFITIDQGTTWSLLADFDSCTNESHFLRASRNTGSHKAVFVHTQFITDSVAAGQLDNDIWYMLSNDNGVTWGEIINLTDYQPSDSVRAYWDVHANAYKTFTNSSSEYMTEFYLWIGSDHTARIDSFPLCVLWNVVLPETLYPDYRYKTDIDMGNGFNYNLVTKQRGVK